jgi:uncharacterized protein YndB with AHSA1/START domain
MSAEKETPSLTFTQQVHASPTAVYYAFTHAAALQEWLCDDSRANAREGGHLYLWWQEGYYATGEFTSVEPDKALAFTWLGRREPGATQVNIALAEENGSTRLTLVHSGMGTGDAWEQMRTELSKGWERGLTNLVSVLETGLDKRIYDRPMLGIMPSGLVEAAEAAVAGLPISGGIRISGVVPGMGAEKAGLQGNDILVEIGGVTLIDFHALRTVLARYQGGDTVEVVLYRDGQKHVIPMVLSRRPTVEVPSDPTEFAASLRQIYDELDAALDDALAGVSEEEAITPPAPGVWCAKDILAHLIGSERVIQVSIGLLLSDDVPSSFPNNPPAWNMALMTVYPTLLDLVALWKRTEAESVALVAALPPALVARKATYFNLGNFLLSGMPAHTRGHIGEIRAAVAAARKCS